MWHGMTDREKVIRALENCTDEIKCRDCPWETCETFCLSVKVPLDLAKAALSLLKAQEHDKSKYEYHTDHTDCPWYISGEESKCPVTCSQYRDGWNDAMNYIFRNGNGYRPYDRIREG